MRNGGVECRSWHLMRFGEDGEDSAATAQSRNLLYAGGVRIFDFYSTIILSVTASLLLSFIMRLPFKGKPFVSALTIIFSLCA